MPAEAIATSTWLGVLTVDVVDGNGIGVAGEPVEACFHLPDGTRARAATTTDATGRAVLIEELRTTPESVVISAAAESVGPFPPTQRTQYVIET